MTWVSYSSSFTVSNNSIRHFSTIGTESADFCLSREGRVFEELRFSLVGVFLMRLILLLTTMANKGQEHCSHHSVKWCGCQRLQCWRLDLAAWRGIGYVSEEHRNCTTGVLGKLYLLTHISECIGHEISFSFLLLRFHFEIPNYIFLVSPPFSHQAGNAVS